MRIHILEHAYFLESKETEDWQMVSARKILTYVILFLLSISIIYFGLAIEINTEDNFSGFDGRCYCIYTSSHSFET
ncbi:hypothetical protein [Acetivibrio straminisolvens]|uniref:Uncharacterized protein n=1 Tax=Acetivibrio straminisolvens JCM 21531 TaxID=1294263 RepID=W4VB60_9FIRM|nr:hypothetical protein JCM21531_3624 [Acetivibrio straminisolvens JCM 21531]